jgi:hypothetical protein
LNFSAPSVVCGKGFRKSASKKITTSRRQA